MRRRLSPWYVAATIAVLLLATIVILLSIPSGKYILLVDTAHPVAPFMQVQGAHPAGGESIYYVDVHERRANELEVLFPWIRPHASFEPAGNVVPPCATAAQAFAAELQEMAVSQRVGAAVASSSPRAEAPEADSQIGQKDPAGGGW